jgi:hypothetical protein
MRYAPLLALILLAAAPLAAGVTNNGDGTSTWWQCSSSTNTTDFDAAVQAFAEDQGSGFHAMAALTIRDKAVVTVGDGVADTGYCGVLQVGRSEWRITLDNTGLGAFRTAWNLRNGWVDVDPADNLDDNTGETANAFADRFMTHDPTAR